MGGINVNRWLLGGLAASAVMFVMEGVSSVLYQADMMAAMAEHGLSSNMTAGMAVLSALTSLLAGLTLVFVYAGIRTRFGPGARTAAIAGLALWFGGYVLTILGFSFLGIFPTSMLVLWAVIGLVELQLAAWVGARIYREA